MIACVFPGQGAQKVGMGKELAEAFAICRETIDEADEALGESLSTLCFEGPEDQLLLTENTQPAILAVSVAIFRLAASRGVNPAFAAGHSLGEYSAHVAAGTLSFADALRTVRRRGRYMQEAVPLGEGAMAAVLGLDGESVAAACAEASAEGIVTPANRSPMNWLTVPSITISRLGLARSIEEPRCSASSLPLETARFRVLPGPDCTVTRTVSVTVN